MMRRLFPLFLTLFVMFTAVLGVQAQETDDDRCSPDSIQAAVTTATENYDILSMMDSDLEAALTSLESLQSELDAVYDDCNAVYLSGFEDDARMVLDLLREGGYVVYVRHTHTDRSRGDTDLSSCDTQRILSERGRDEARDIGAAYATLDLPVSRLISTEYCRTLETARLAFGEPEVITRTDLTDTLNAVLATQPEPETNTFIVAHIGTLNASTITVGPDGDSLFEEGDSLIIRPLDDGTYEFVARIPLAYWGLMADIAAEG